jgi:hypothetical protein
MRWDRANRKTKASAASFCSPLSFEAGAAFSLEGPHVGYRLKPAALPVM